MTEGIPTITSAAALLQKGVTNVAELSKSEVKGRKWVWDQWIPEAKPVLLGGPPGAGKSYLAQTICMAASEGIELFGYQTNSRPTLYLTCEDDIAELNRRAKSIANGLERPTSAFKACYLVSLEGLPDTSLCNKDGTETEFYRALDQFMAYYAFGLVVLDVVSDYWDGNEIVRQEVNHFVKSVIASLAVRHEAAIMLLYHPSQQGKTSGDGQSGSTAWDGSARSRLYLKTDKAGVRELSSKKSNYSDPEAMNLVWSDGAFYLTNEAFMESDRNKMPKGKHARSVLAKLEEGGGKVHYSELSKELSSRSAWDAVKALQKKGFIRRDDEDFVWLTHDAIGNPKPPV